MKTKIKTISPDQNIIEHESGLRTVFVEGGKCINCIYYPNGINCSGVLCDINRDDKMSGNYKLIEQ